MSSETAQNEFRGRGVPFTEDEIVEYLAMFRGLPTYNKEGRYILTSDFGAIIKFLRLDQPAEREAAFIKYYEDNFNGRLPEDVTLEHARSFHDTATFSTTYSSMFDSDGDGFINATEFEQLLDIMRAHDPKLKGKSFEQFLKEADINEDGKVSIAETKNWIEKALAKNT